MLVCSSITFSVRERQDAFEASWIERADTHALSYGVLAHAKQQREIHVAVCPESRSASTNESRDVHFAPW